MADMTSHQKALWTHSGNQMGQSKAEENTCSRLQIEAREMCGRNVRLVYTYLDPFSTSHFTCAESNANATNLLFSLICIRFGVCKNATFKTGLSKQEYKQDDANH